MGKKVKDYIRLTDRILKEVSKEEEMTPTEVAKILKENIQNVSSTMYYLFLKGKLKKRKIKRNAYYSINEKI